MASSDSVARTNALKVLGGLPTELSFVHRDQGECVQELTSNKCIVALLFERYESSKCNVILMNPNSNSADRDAMSFWVLRHIRAISTFRHDSEDMFTAIGRILAESLSDLLGGDFSTIDQYRKLEREILDKMPLVLDLPDYHPAKILFNKYDIRWIDMLR